MGGIEIKSSLLLSTLLIGCARVAKSPESAGQLRNDETPAAEIWAVPESFFEKVNETQVKVNFPNGAAINLCSNTDPYLGGTFVRENGELVFYLVNDPRHTRFTFLKGEQFPFDQGLVVSDNQSNSGRDNPDNPKEDFVQYDSSLWAISCSTVPPAGQLYS